MVGAVRQQAFTSASVDPDFFRHIALLGHNELTKIPVGWPVSFRLAQHQLIQTLYLNALLLATKGGGVLITFSANCNRWSDIEAMSVMLDLFRNNLG